MKPDVVVDIGNTRMKWGRCADGRVEHWVSLSADNDVAWHQQMTAWQAHAPRRWAIASVHPIRRDRFLEWLEGGGHQVIVLDRYAQLPLTVLVDQPEKVGMDRLLNAVAAETRRAGNPAMIVDVGSAVTVDVVDEMGAFRGGSIFPGIRLMAQALHDHTALLPLVEVTEPPVSIIGSSTASAIKSGIYHAVLGAIGQHCGTIHKQMPQPCAAFLTGGDAHLFRDFFNTRDYWPEMTLEGIRIAAEAQP